MKQVALCVGAFVLATVAYGEDGASSKATDTTPVSEVETIVSENPKLVPVLVRMAAEGDSDEAGVALYSLGTSIIEPLLDEAEGDDPEVRSAALQLLCYACLHDDAPRSKVVGRILAVREKSDAETASEMDELLVFIVRCADPKYRELHHRALQAEMIGELGQSAPLQDCPGGVCPPPAPVGYYVPVEEQPGTGQLVAPGTLR